MTSIEAKVRTLMAALRYEKPKVDPKLERVELTKDQCEKVMEAVRALGPLHLISHNSQQYAALQVIKTFYPDVVEFGKSWFDSDWYVDIPANK